MDETKYLLMKASMEMDKIIDGTSLMTLEEQEEFMILIDVIYKKYKQTISGIENNRWASGCCLEDCSKCGDKHDCDKCS